MRRLLTLLKLWPVQGVYLGCLTNDQIDELPAAAREES